MNGSGMPLVGIRPSTTLRFISAWPTTIVVMPSASSRPNSSGAFIAARKSPPAVNRKQRQHDRRADKPELLADHRKNEVRVRLGQKEQLLAALHQADAGKPARPDGDQRLQQLKAVALRVRPG